METKFHPLPQKGAQQPPRFSAHVYCGQTTGWIRMPLGMEVGLGPGHKRGTAPNFRPMSVVAKRLEPGWIKMPLGTEVSLGAGDILLDGDAAPQKGYSSPQFLAHVYCGQTAEWIKMPLRTEVSLGPGHIVLDVDPAPKNNGGTAPTSQLMSVVAKRLDGSGYHLVQRYASAQATLDGNPVLPPHRKGHSSPPHFSAHFAVAESTNSAAAEHLLHSSRQGVHILYNGPSLCPSKLPLAVEGSGPPSNTWFLGPTRVLNPNGISIC